MPQATTNLTPQKAHSMIANVLADADLQFQGTRRMEVLDLSDPTSFFQLFSSAVKREPVKVRQIVAAYVSYGMQRFANLHQTEKPVPFGGDSETELQNPRLSNHVTFMIITCVPWQHCVHSFTCCCCWQELLEKAVVTG